MGHLGYSSLLITVNGAAINMHFYVPIQVSVFNSFGHKSRFGIAGSCGNYYYVLKILVKILILSWKTGD